jgi:glycosyltransferase involved in cell wall biosynthesis
MTTDVGGGIWRFAISLCKTLRERNIEVVLATMGGPLSAGQRAAAGGLGNVTLAESNFRLEWMRDSEGDVAESGQWLLELAARNRVDLVHVNGYAHAALPFGRPVVAVAHSDLISWFEAVRGEPAPASRDRYRLDVERGLVCAIAVVAPTHAVKGDLTRHFNLVPERCRVISNGIDLRDYRLAPKRDVILGAGRVWDGAKNVAQLDRVAPRVAWPVEIAGEGGRSDGGGGALRAAIPLGVLTQPEMAARFAGAAIHAAPARYEPFGLGILEAAASGCALVLGDIPSLRENWHDAAIFVPPNDDAALIAALNRLIADTPARVDFARRALARSRAFDIDRTGAEYTRLYRSLVPEGASIS